MVLWRQTRDVHIVIPEELLAEVDAAASEKYMSRSEFIRNALDKEVGGKYPKELREIWDEDPSLFADMNDS